MPRTSNARETILERAVQIASVHGLEGLTIGSLAGAVGMSKGGISAHFPSKLALQLASVERAALDFREAVIVPARPHAHGLDRLRAFDRAWFSYLRRGVFDGGCFFTNAVLEQDDITDEVVREAVIEQYELLLVFLEREAAHAIQMGQFRADLNAKQFVLEFMGLRLSALLWRGLGRLEEGLQLAEHASAELLARVMG